MGLDFAPSYSLDENDWLTFLSLKSELEKSHCVYLFSSPSVEEGFVSGPCTT